MGNYKYRTTKKQIKTKPMNATKITINKLK
jgi:hypothetical protein